MAVIWGVCGLALLALVAPACSDNGAGGGPTPGVATIGFAPKPFGLPYINLNRAKVQLDRLQLLGNVPPPPPPGSQPPPGGHPPPDGSWPTASVDLDALSTALPSNATIEDLPLALYSRVRFTIGRIQIDGTMRGTVFHVSIAPFGLVVDVRASVPQELGLEQNVSFQVSVDPNLWFPPYLFENAMLDSRGEISVDDVSNPQAGGVIIQGMVNSFSLP